MEFSAIRSKYASAASVGILAIGVLCYMAVATKEQRQLSDFKLLSEPVLNAMGKEVRLPRTDLLGEKIVISKKGILVLIMPPCGSCTKENIMPIARKIRGLTHENLVLVFPNARQDVLRRRLDYKDNYLISDPKGEVIPDLWSRFAPAGVLLDQEHVVVKAFPDLKSVMTYVQG